MRVLLLAEQCNPNLSSVALVGYNLCNAISRQVESSVIVTAVRNRESIQRVGEDLRNYHFVENEELARRSLKVSQFLRAGLDWGTVLRIPLFIHFEREIYRHFHKDLSAGKFDIIHRVTPTSAAIPSPMASWSPIPFILGPVNGGLAYPSGFKGTQLKEGEWLRFFRKAYLYGPYMSSTLKRSAAILASFPHTIRTLPKATHSKTMDLPEVGADSNRFQYTPRSSSTEKCKFLFVGRLVPFKCPLVNVQAFAASPALREHELIIVGDGPERAAIETCIRKHSLENCVRLLGWIPQSKVAELMNSADVFAFPSIRDAGAGVLAEAMMSGLPSITVNYGPPESLLTDECGIRVPLGSFEDHVQSFRAAMEKLAVNPELRASMGHASHHRASRILDWDVKAKRIVQVYEWVLGRRKDKPDFYSEEPV